MEPVSTEIQGWFLRNNETGRVRVRVAIEDRSLAIETLAGAPVGRLPLDGLENRGIPYWTRDWPIGDRDQPEQTLTLQNDEDYAAIQSASPGLRSVRARMWRQMMVSPGAHGNLKAWPALIWAILVAGLAIALWRGASR
ncbi:MAG TPA: hypothetical protein VFG64_15900 [Dongiaceae bacterium]|nr:hypothetical protein [Dongiaceae bacterium]